MKNLLLTLLLLQTTNLFCQDIKFERISPETTYGDIDGKIYQCIGALTNTTNDSIEIKYIRITKEFSFRTIYTSLCTDYLCYFVSQDTVVEAIPPMNEHKVETRWQVSDPTLISGRGYSEWLMIRTDNKEVIDTFKSEFIYNINSTSTNNLSSIQLKVHPNPTTNTIELPFASFDNLKIFNQLGQTVFTLNKVQDNAISVSSFKKGEYFGQIHNDGKLYHFSFIKI